LHQSNEVKPEVAPKLPSDSIRKWITALALLLFLIGLVLPFLAPRSYITEYMPSERLGYEWLLKGSVENARKIVRRAVGRQPLPSHSYSWLVGTSAILCLPMSFVVIRRRPLWATCLALVGMIGVVWIFILATPWFILGDIGPGFICWFLSAALATGVSIRSRLAKTPSSPR
jgi:hypothetical protein